MDGRNPLSRFVNSMFAVLDGPVTFFREKIVEPNQQHYPYYHQKFRRVPGIEDCYTDDKLCEFEAQQQFARDKEVESEILNILRQRFEHCMHEDENQRGEEKCNNLYKVYEDAAEAWFCKYGDLGPDPQAKIALLKQKHRMIWERRHGPVGTGMKNLDPFKVSEDDH